MKTTRALALAAALSIALPAFAAPGERRPGPDEWWDGRYGHGHVYPTPGAVYPRLPGRPGGVVYGGSRYWFDGGVWYAGRPGGYVVVRPPRGIVIDALPAFATVVTIGALTYYYANDVYYRPLQAGGYQVVDPPADDGSTRVGVQPKLFIYPRQGQTAERQASDEYECHRWAAAQSGFDPTKTAAGEASGDDAKRADYTRANSACLDGRGYTVR